LLNIIELDDQNVCVSLKQVTDGYALQYGEMLYSEYDVSVLGKTYDPSTGEFAYTQAQIEDQAREWRDAELKRTDSIMLLPDYPQKEALTAYRQELRDWPGTDQFPDTRPQLA
jgi:hypothetical protein